MNETGCSSRTKRVAPYGAPSHLERPRIYLTTLPLARITYQKPPNSSTA